MKIAFRVDSSTAIGTGHTMRCVALALALVNQGKNLKKGTPVSSKSIQFLFRSQAGDLVHWIEQCGFETKQLDGDTMNDELVGLEQFFKSEKQAFDWLIVDHYGIDSDWEKRLQPFVKKILVIDDMPNRKHSASYLLDQNWINLNEGEKAYQPHVSPNCTLWLGPRYALLRKEFAVNHVKARDQRISTQEKAPERLLIFFGGSDPTGETLPMLKIVQTLIKTNQLPPLEIDVIAGDANPLKSEIEAFCQSQSHITFHGQTESMADLMLKADWAMGAGGVATWERLCLGLPAFVIAVAENQIQLSKSVAESAKAQIFLGLSERYQDEIPPTLDPSPAEGGGEKNSQRNELESNMLFPLTSGLPSPLAGEGAGWGGHPVATHGRIKEALIHYFHNTELRFKMSLAGLSLVDGMGAARIADLMEQANEPRRRL